MKKTQGIGANFIRKDGEASEQKKITWLKTTYMNCMYM